MPGPNNQARRLLKKMNYRAYLIAACIAAVQPIDAPGQNRSFTSDFPLANCHFSVFGGHPHFILNPGHQLVLAGNDHGQQVEMTITALDATKAITLAIGTKTRTILARVIEEREKIDGQLHEVARYWYARCIETGDIYHFGNEAEFYEEGKLTGTTRLWEAGVQGAMPGIIMPGTFMLGARYFQNRAPGIAVDQAENIAMAVTLTTPAGVFTNCVQIRESDGLRPENEPAIKSYAPGVGLVDDEGILKLREFRLGAAGLPRGCTFSPFSNNPYLPFAPGRQLVLEGMEQGRPIVLRITALDELKHIRIALGNEERLIPARIIEERRSSGGQLVEMARSYYAQCLETGDVYCFGREIERQSSSGAVVRSGWMAGDQGAQPGFVMPGDIAAGARFAQEAASGTSEITGMISASGLALTVPAGTFHDCIAITETNLLLAGGAPAIKTYAPGFGLIDLGGTLKLTSFTLPGDAGSPILSIQDAVLLTWPLTDRSFRIERSSNLQDWTPLDQLPLPIDGRNQLQVPRDAAKQYFRLSLP